MERKLLNVKLPDEVDIKSVRRGVVPGGRVLSMLYLPTPPSRQDVIDSMDHKLFTRLTGDKLESYIEREQRLATHNVTYYYVSQWYPLDMMHSISISGSDNDSIDFQLLDMLLNVLGRIPEMSLSDMSELIAVIRDIDASVDTGGSKEMWTKEAKSILDTVSPGALDRNFWLRVEEVLQGHHNDASKQLDLLKVSSASEGHLEKIPVVLSFEDLSEALRGDTFGQMHIDIRHAEVTLEELESDRLEETERLESVAVRSVKFLADEFANLG